MVKHSSPKPKKTVQVGQPLPLLCRHGIDHNKANCIHCVISEATSWSSPAYTFTDGMGWEQHIPAGYHDMGH